MEYRQTLVVPDQVADQMERLLREPDADLGRDEPVYDEEVTFANGNRVAIQVIASTEPAKEECWSQAVGFTADGFEFGFSEASDELLGEWFVQDNVDVYVVNVVRESAVHGPSKVSGQES